MTIQAIETTYAGCRFRSRLEARWAVFFDHIGARWEYEPQGFKMPSGKHYLPDFLLVDCGTWVEVKGDPSRIQTESLMEAARHLPKMPVTRERGPALLILGPIPAPLGTRDGDYGWAGLSLDCFDRVPGIRVDRFGFGAYSKNLRPWYHSSPSHSSAPPITHSSKAGWITPTVDPYEYSDMGAYVAARSARFEHGESGVLPAQSQQTTSDRRVDRVVARELTKAVLTFVIENEGCHGWEIADRVRGRASLVHDAVAKLVATGLIEKIKLRNGLFGYRAISL